MPHLPAFLERLEVANSRALVLVALLPIHVVELEVLVPQDSR